MQSFHMGNPVSPHYDIWTNGSCLPTTNAASSYDNGSYPRFAVKAESIGDVQKALDFARKNNVRLVIKNTGYIGMTGVIALLCTVSLTSSLDTIS